MATAVPRAAAGSRKRKDRDDADVEEGIAAGLMSPDAEACLRVLAKIPRIVGYQRDRRGRRPAIDLGSTTEAAYLDAVALVFEEVISQSQGDDRKGEAADSDNEDDDEEEEEEEEEEEGEVEEDGEDEDDEDEEEDEEEEEDDGEEESETECATSTRGRGTFWVTTVDGKVERAAGTATSGDEDSDDEGCADPVPPLLERSQSWSSTTSWTIVRDGSGAALAWRGRASVGESDSSDDASSEEDEDDEEAGKEGKGGGSRSTSAALGKVWTTASGPQVVR